MSDNERDFLAAMIAKRTAKNSAFPALLAVARQRRLLERQAIERRSHLGLAVDGRAEEISATTHLDANKLLPRSQRHERYIAGRVVRHKG